jgi:hypothetical protein
MFGIGPWELLLIGVCCGVPVIVGATVAVVLLMGNQPRQQ